MKMRVRVALWYSLALLFGLLLIAAIGYYEMVVAHPEIKAALVAGGHTPLREIAEVLFFGGFPAIMVALIGGWIFLRRALAPLATLTEAAEGVQVDTLNQRLPRNGSRDEIDRLTVVLNDMMARLEDSFSRVRDFTLHASHELKTPLTIMRSEMESALRGGTVIQPELLANQLDEIERLTKIVDGLAFLAKADASKILMNSVPIRLDELVREMFAEAKILAEPAKIQVSLTACDEATVKGDRHRLRQLLLNLVDNAIKYNEPKGTVIVSLRRRPTEVELRIENTGPGIPFERLPRVFDRFYRGDSSRGHEVEGSGLGLSIAQWIVHAHGGKIGVTSTPNALTAFTVVLPPG